MASSLAFVLLLGSFILTAPANADPFFTDCPSNTINYTRGSAFEANLNALLSSIPAAAAASSGFATNITGAAPDQVFGLAQCSADTLDASDCQACLDRLARNVTSSCPGRKAALIVEHVQRCMLRYSGTSFFGSTDTSWWRTICNLLDAETELFVPRLAALMNNLTVAAAHGPRLFAADSVEVTPSVRIFGMVQCTRDLTGGGCMTCLSDAVNSITENCFGKVGGRMFEPSCAIRYEVFTFYDVKAVEVAMSPSQGSGDGPINGSSAPDRGSTGSKRTVRTALLVAISVAVTLLVVVPLVALYLCKRKRKLQNQAKIASDSRRHGDDKEEMRSSESILYDLSTLRAATNNFSEENKLGEGGFGPVYKGVLENGQEIAVKRLSTTSHQGQVEMKNEVFLVSKLQHKNLVRILGCCIQEHEKLLVYEFLSNNSLDKILFDPERQHELSWGQRRKIIAGIGRGLLYLHEDSRLTIIHRDLKASNVLLDADMNPKISDFGLAKLFNVDSSFGNTSRIAGTYGYMAPEYALRGIFSAKSDVFSYGVLVLEIITGRCNTQAEGSEDLLSFVWRCWRHGSIGELLNGCPADGRQPQEVLRCIHIGLLCVQEDPQLRPGIASVVIMLNSRSITLPAPTAPAFAVVRAAIDALGSSTDPDSSRVAARQPSINEASVSDMEPR